MFGISVYLNQRYEDIENYINKMHELGVMDVFSSFHINEYNKEETLDQLEKVSKLIASKDMDLILDISTNTLELYDFTIDDMVEFLGKLNVKKVRLDYGFNFDQIKRISDSLEIVLNASTIDEKFIQELKNRDIDLSKITASHNYYPRPETGLSSKSFNLKNKFLQNCGFKIQAFIPGDKERRGPLFEGLPTLEEHRHWDSFRAYLDLKIRHNIENIHLGDISANKESILKIIQFENNAIIELRINELIKISEVVEKVLYGTHQNRADNSDIVIRSSNSRLEIKEKIKPENIITRKIGSITIDNEKYLRYNGEIQIALKDLEMDEKVNVLARVIESDIDILEYIGSNIKFRFKREEYETSSK